MTKKSGLLAYGAGFVLMLSPPAIAADPAGQELPFNGLEIDLTAYYLMTSHTGEPAFGSHAPIVGTGVGSSHSISETTELLKGGGIRLAGKKWLDGEWFLSAVYSGFFTSDQSSIGNAGINGNNVYAALLDRSLGDASGLDFDDGVTDFASEDISVSQNFLDIVTGKRAGGIGPLSTSWHSGVRLAHVDVDRNVLYADQGAPGDSARIGFGSTMWGAGPTVGGSLDLLLSPQSILSISASASAVVGHFDVSRSDMYAGGGAGVNGARLISANVTDVVPVFDASVTWTRQIGRFTASVGYTASAWIGAARSFQTISMDDVDDGTSPYAIVRDDLIAHGVFLRISTGLGPFAGAGDSQASLFDGAGETAWDLTGYYLLSSLSGTPAFGSYAPIAGAPVNSGIISSEGPLAQGGGVRINGERMLAGNWFAGVSYTGFFASETDSAGNSGVDGDTVYAGQLNRSLSDETSLNGMFDSGIVDYASDDVSARQHFVDLTLGQHDREGVLGTFWQAGLRLAHTSTDRHIVYQNLEGAADLDTADIQLGSRMWGVGPTVGGGFNLAVSPNTTLTGSASVSALYSYFNVDRRDVYTNSSTGNQGVSTITTDIFDIVPVFDATVALTRHFGRVKVSVGYTASAWLGGSRSYETAGMDDIDDDTSPYLIARDDIITHAFFLRGGMALGATAHAPSGESLFGDGGATEVELTGYYVFSDFDSSPAFGALTVLALPTSSSAVSEDLFDASGGGIRVAARRMTASDWVASIAYTGFFTGGREGIGSAATDTDNVYASLVDRSMADEHSLNGNFDDGIVDAASDDLSIATHTVDLTLGRAAGTGQRFNGFWQGGLRLAHVDTGRDVTYWNEEGGDLDSANIHFDSRMWGVGPTIGGGFVMDVTPTLALTSSTSVSALYSRFDVSRSDRYLNQSLGTTMVREVSSSFNSFVPVIDGSLELTKTFGRLRASIGYTSSIWIGGSRTLLTASSDDIDDDAQAYIFAKDDIITHGVFARITMGLGGDPIVTKY